VVRVRRIGNWVMTLSGKSGTRATALQKGKGPGFAGAFLLENGGWC
jgi:hypothetical protein